MNSAIETAANVVRIKPIKLKQRHRKRRPTTQESKVGGPLKMGKQRNAWLACYKERQLIGEEDTFLLAVEGRSERRDWKWSNSNTRSGITNKVSCNKNITGSNRQQMQTGSAVWQDNWPRACPILAKEQSIERHGTCAELHFNLREEIGVKLDNEHWYQHAPESVQAGRSGKVTILWNQGQTDRPIPSNKSDIILRENEKGTMLMDIAMSRDKNVVKKGAEKPRVSVQGMHWSVPTSF